MRLDETTRLRAKIGWCAAAAMLAAVVSWTMPALAQDDVADLPSRVGRVSDVAGDLFVATQDRVNEWAPIGLNYPIITGDNLWVSANGRAEVDFGNGVLRLSGDTNLQIATLDDGALVLFVASGKAIVRVRTLASGEVAQINTPHTKIDIARPGQYRVDVDAGNERTTLTVREGEAGIHFSGGIQQALSGQAATVMGLDGAGLAIQNGFGSDGFDTWSSARDQRYDASRFPAYVSADMVGVRDLDDYGTWESTPAYGPVWYPSTVAVGWAPYRYGSWAWVAPFGWTWVDAAPWGYAPFHFGRWIWASGRWGWCPGDRVGRPRWAPALVVWYGGPGWDGGGTVYGWVPLGWGEAYVPTWRHCSDNCWRQYNQPYAVTQADRRPASQVRYANAAVPGGMTAVNAAVLSGSRPVAPNQLTTDGWMARAPVLARAPERGPRVQNAAPSAVAVPIPAGAQFQQLSRTARGADATMPTQPTAASNASVLRHATAPAALTPGGASAGLALPPARGTVAIVPSSEMAPSMTVYRNGQGTLGAYTGALPTPGPKAPVVGDRGIALPANVPAVPVRSAPVGIVPQAVFAAPAGMVGVAREAPVPPAVAPVRSAPATSPAAAGALVAPAPVTGVPPR
jgi:hypothetical protein